MNTANYDDNFGCMTRIDPSLSPSHPYSVTSLCYPCVIILSLPMSSLPRHVPSPSVSYPVLFLPISPLHHSFLPIIFLNPPRRYPISLLSHVVPIPCVPYVMCSLPHPVPTPYVPYPISSLPMFSYHMSSLPHVFSTPSLP